MRSIINKKTKAPTHELGKSANRLFAARSLTRSSSCSFSTAISAAFGIALGLSLLTGASSAQAGIILGDSVDVAIYAPTRDEVCFLCGGITRVEVADNNSDSVEPYLPGGGWFDVDVDPTSISIRFNRDISWQSDSFVGLVVSDIDWLDGAVRGIPGAMLTVTDASGVLISMTELLSDGLSFTDTSVAVNWQGSTFNAGTSVEIALGAAMAPAPDRMGPGTALDVTEPGTLLMLVAVLGFLLLQLGLKAPYRYRHWA